jgi:hypothetical protein
VCRLLARNGSDEIFDENEIRFHKICESEMAWFRAFL